jgi:pectin methylesterase-like acyl-CoA thioesterase
MKTVTSGLLIVLLCTCLFWFAVKVQPVKATTITVPDDYPTIQAAINAAIPGDTIYVRNGLYPEHLEINKAVTLEGESKLCREARAPV